MLNDLKSEQVLRVLLTCGKARSLVLMCGIGTIEVNALRCARFDSRSSLVVQLKSSALILRKEERCLPHGLLLVPLVALAAN